ncbi:Farnesyl pyrophosphate synthetase [Coelomomyces lativittatus]|nr:Farnesyl pyrophosphate synthetase [Coelomomyces lativittatus]KAJ1510908.1 Farnesyl pyrophosphate synthetase [Coelomomyces lativittatus]KAJ1517923.1 Farnesyl pyrophosphate synthetase [Coelomomyces lativittatus]
MMSTSSLHAMKEGFELTYHELVNDILQEVKEKQGMPQDGIGHMKKMLDYNVCGGKLNRGLSVIETLHILAEAYDRKLTHEEIKDAHVAGWAIEWLQASFLVADDLMDQSLTRRGKPCWFRMDGVGYHAVNDAFILESQAYRMLHRQFRNHPQYTSILDLFHEVCYFTECGQLLDMLSSQHPLEHFDNLRYHFITVYKTSYYTFYLPVAISFMLFGLQKEIWETVCQSILLPLGTYFQIQDDFLDCFGDPKVLGKIGTDIQEHKCTWLITTALTLANDQQRKTLTTWWRKTQVSASQTNEEDEKNMAMEKRGAPLDKKVEEEVEEESVKHIKQVYRELNLENVYREYEEKSYQQLLKRIEALEIQPLVLNAASKRVFSNIMDKIYKRSK